MDITVLIIMAALLGVIAFLGWAALTKKHWPKIVSLVAVCLYGAFGTVFALYRVFTPPGFGLQEFFSWALSMAFAIFLITAYFKGLGINIWAWASPKGRRGTNH